ncbi:hypothetical protein N0V85_008237 [Neurospora sp. IMI 360204]|nr:hypothetical protein N0V85_008237 [Neurospora sp. IMI 360204]
MPLSVTDDALETHGSPSTNRKNANKASNFVHDDNGEDYDNSDNGDNSDNDEDNSKVDDDNSEVDDNDHGDYNNHGNQYQGHYPAMDSQNAIAAGVQQAHIPSTDSIAHHHGNYVGGLAGVSGQEFDAHQSHAEGRLKGPLSNTEPSNQQFYPAPSPHRGTYANYAYPGNNFVWEEDLYEI